MIGYIVEGHMEEEILRSICKKSEIRRLQMNGVDFPIEQIARRISVHIPSLRKKVSHIVVVLDREQRAASSKELEETLLEAITARAPVDVPITVVSPDRNIESWILPFLNDNCEITEEPNEHRDGCHGKSIIKAKFKAKRVSYTEVVDGVKLFKKLKPSRLKQTSESFGRFVERYDEDCWWLEK